MDIGIILLVLFVIVISISSVVSKLKKGEKIGFRPLEDEDFGKSPSATFDPMKSPTSGL